MDNENNYGPNWAHDTFIIKTPRDFSEIRVDAISRRSLTAPAFSDTEKLGYHSAMAIHEQKEETRPLIHPAEGEARRPEDEEEEGIFVEGLVRRTLAESQKLWRIAGPSIFSRLSMFSLTIISMAFSSGFGNLDLAALSIATTVIIPFSFGFMLGMASALETLWIMLLLENVYYRFVIILSGHLHISEISLDGLSICNTIFSWESMIPLGFLAATGVRVANELGAGQARTARFAVSVSLFNALVVGVMFLLVVIAFPDKLARIFTSSDSIVVVVTQLSPLLAFAIVINCVQPVFSGMAVGCGWQALATIVNLGSYYVVGLPLGIMLGWLLPFGIKGIWSGLIGGTVVQTLLLGLINVKYDCEEEVRKARNLAMEAHV
ncbi:hypothetical protein MLD38_022415 [Melastoma candidum]|uniref:Uncharacterized protein n=1 Tax=Melastoma candidum TaxID=119954 RepID=A0ACB9QKZ9_9MYRT|nr:hypothetical protein MLD38_022415 [Melastoma candidum]